MAQPQTTDTARRWAAVTPSDTARLAKIPAALYCSTSGNVVVKGDDGVSATFAVLAGQILPVRPFFVMATNTTATVIALYNDIP